MKFLILLFVLQSASSVILFQTFSYIERKLIHYWNIQSTIMGMLAYVKYAYKSNLLKKKLLIT